MPNQSWTMKDTEDIVMFGWVGIILTLLIILITHT